MASPVDGSKPTTPRSSRRDVAPCPAAPECQQCQQPKFVRVRKGRKGRKLNFWLPRADNQGFGLQGFASANCQIASGNCGGYDGG
jgi:hypothetical protein